MRIHELITESFGDARVAFGRDASPQDVIKYIDRFKELTNKNLIKGQENDIGTWINAGWDDFRDYIDQFNGATSKSASKKNMKKDRILVHEDDKIRVVVPLSKEASCFYGKNTQWCTTASKDEDNYWDRYFYHNRDTMFYLLPKNEDPKFSVLLQADDTTKQILYTDGDAMVPFEQITERYDITKEVVEGWYLEFRNEIMAARDLNNLDEHVQTRILTKFPEFVTKINNPSEDMLVSVASSNAQLVRYLDNPSEEVLLAAVSRNVRIMHSIEAPSEAVQLKAIECNPLSYTLIKNPTERATELYNSLKESTMPVTASSGMFQRSTGDRVVDSNIKKTTIMSPDEYLKQAYSVTDGRLGGSFDGWMASNERTKEDVVRYSKAMQNGEKFPMPWIDYESGSQDGRNRALAAMILGIKEIPVGIIPRKATDERITVIQDELQTATGYKKFRLESELERLRNEQE